MEWSEGVAVKGASPAKINKRHAVSKKSPVQRYSDEAVERNKEYINIG